jgi:xanthine dehydrogenase molybdopterin-binding subunit B
VKELIQTKRRLAGVVHVVRLQIEADVQAMRREDAELAVMESRCIEQLIDDVWASLRNPARIAGRLLAIRQKRASLKQALSEALAKASQKRISEDRLAEQIGELEAETEALVEEESAIERAGMQTVGSFSYAQDP